MSEVSFGKFVSLSQAVDLIIANPDLRFMLEGEPGIGKSSMLKVIGERTGYPTAYIDVPNMDLGDIAMPVVNRESRVTEYFPNSMFKLHLGVPVAIMADEYPKGPDTVKNMLHPLFEKTNPRLGDVPVPKGSHIFMTGNLSTDGVGDTLKSHSINRLVRIKVRKPNAEEWVAWAIGAGINPIVVAWVNRFPHVMCSYLEPGQGDNVYIFNPKRPQASFVSPRSLESASSLFNRADQYDGEALLAALIGTVGEAGARDLYSFKEVSDQLPVWEAVLKSPDTVDVPTSPGACAITVFGAIARVTKESINPFMEYLQRFPAEWQAVFAINIAKNPTKQAIAFASRSFAEWVAKNQDLL